MEHSVTCKRWRESLRLVSAHDRPTIMKLAGARIIPANAEGRVSRGSEVHGKGLARRCIHHVLDTDISQTNPGGGQLPIRLR